MWFFQETKPWAKDFHVRENNVSTVIQLMNLERCGTSNYHSFFIYDTVLSQKTYFLFPYSAQNPYGDIFTVIAIIFINFLSFSYIDWAIILFLSTEKKSYLSLDFWTVGYNCYIEKKVHSWRSRQNYD